MLYFGQILTVESVRLGFTRLAPAIRSADMAAESTAVTAATSAWCVMRNIPANQRDRVPSAPTLKPDWELATAPARTQIPISIPIPIYSKLVHDKAVFHS